MWPVEGASLGNGRPGMVSREAFARSSRTTPRPPNLSLPPSQQEIGPSDPSTISHTERKSHAEGLDVGRLPVASSQSLSVCVREASTAYVHVLTTADLPDQTIGRLRSTLFCHFLLVGFAFALGVRTLSSFSPSPSP